MLPWTGRTMPASAFRQVLLPAPFAPISATSSPSRTWRSMPRSASTAPYATRRSLTSSMGRLSTEAIVLAEIGLHHARVRPDDRGRALGQLLSVLQHGDPIRDPHHEVHVMLDQQDRRATRADANDELVQLADLSRIQPRGRLVHREQQGGENEGSRDLHEPLMAEGEGLPERLRRSRIPDERQHGHRDRAPLTLLTAEARRHQEAVDEAATDPGREPGED